MDSYINKMVEDLKAQIEDYETIDLVLTELEDMVTCNTSVLHEWTYGKDGEVTARLVNPRAPKIIEEIIGVIKDFYMLVEPPKELHEEAEEEKAAKTEPLFIVPREG